MPDVFNNNFLRPVAVRNYGRPDSPLLSTVTRIYASMWKKHFRENLPKLYPPLSSDRLSYRDCSILLGLKLSEAMASRRV